MKFVIDRSKWRCGACGPFKRGEGDVRLLNQEGYMCCLGQIELQLGLTEEQIYDKSRPYHTEVANILCEFNPVSNYMRDSALATKALYFNDLDDLSDRERELELQKVFAGHNHELEFVGEYLYD